MEPRSNGSRYVTWAQYGQDRERDRNVYATQGDLIESRDNVMVAVSSVRQTAKDNTARIDDLQRQLTAAPDGDRPGGLIWQMSEMRREQKALVRNLALVLTAAAAIFNIFAPYIGDFLRTFLHLPPVTP